MFFIANVSCDICAKKIISEETALLVGIPDNQKKAAAIERILKKANKLSTKPCVRILCKDDTYHNFCVEHLYAMIDAVKEYEMEAKDQ